MFNMMSTVI